MSCTCNCWAGPGKRQIKNPKLGLAHNMGNEPYAPVVSICIVGL